MKSDHPFQEVPLFIKLKAAIIKEVAPEKIYVLSTCRQRIIAENIFNVPLESEYGVQYDLLILTVEKEQRSNDTIQDVIENRCAADGLVTAFVLPVQQFNKWLMNGHPFAAAVYQYSFLCFDAGNTPLAVPNTCQPEMQHVMREEFDQHCKLATEFLSGASLFDIRKQFPLAVFNLHQAAEQLYTAIIRRISGLNVHTHNLDKLYRYSRNLLAGLIDIFPCNNQHEKYLFKLLQKAYIDSRYRNDYVVKQSEVTLLRARVIRLLEICQSMNNQV